MKSLRAGIAAYGVISAAGGDAASHAQSVLNAQLPELDVRTIGSDGAVLPVAAVRTGLLELSGALAAYDCRNNRMAAHLIAQIRGDVDDAIARFGADRVAVVVGSSTSGLDETERAIRQRVQSGVLPSNYSFEHQHSMGSLARFIALAAGARGPAYTVSTACASSARAMLCGAGLLHSGIADAVITGGVDSLCDLTVHGFYSLGSLSDIRMNPMSVNRNGLNIGEGGALFLLTRDECPLMLMGGGESMDAHHMSAPDPEGRGATAAMARALVASGLSKADIDYVNLHGTATRANDAMESVAVHAMFHEVPASSTKPMTGHCLGAAGAVEAAICCLASSVPEKLLPPHVYDGQYDSALPPITLVQRGDRLSGVYVLSNSFAFGGSNCSLVFRCEEPSR